MTTAMHIKLKMKMTEFIIKRKTTRQIEYDWHPFAAFMLCKGNGNISCVSVHLYLKTDYFALSKKKEYTVILFSLVQTHFRQPQ